MVAAKALLYVLIAVVGSSAAVFTADGWSSGWARWNVLIVAAGALALWLKSNTPSQPWAKSLVALFAAGVTVLVSAWSDGHIDATELQQIVLVVLGTAQVGATQNVPAEDATGVVA